MYPDMEKEFKLIEHYSRLIIKIPFLFTMGVYSTFITIGVITSLVYGYFVEEFNSENWYRMFIVETPYSSYTFYGYLLYYVHSVANIFCAAMSLSNSLNLFASPLLYIEGFNNAFCHMIANLHMKSINQSLYLINSVRLQMKIHELVKNKKKI